MTSNIDLVLAYFYNASEEEAQSILFAACLLVPLKSLIPDLFSFNEYRAKHGVGFLAAAFSPCLGRRGDCRLDYLDCSQMRLGLVPSSPTWLTSSA